MGDQVRELLNWARQRKILAAAFVGFTLVVGILIGSVVSGRVSATKGFGFPGTTATTLTVPDPIPASCRARGGQYRHDAGAGAPASAEDRKSVV